MSAVSRLSFFPEKGGCMRVRRRCGGGRLTAHDADTRMGLHIVPLGGDLDDQVSSVGPDNPYYCFFFR